MLVRGAAAELPRVELVDALAICLVFLEGEPEAFERAAVRWVARLALERKLCASDLQLALAALRAMSDGEQAAAAGALAGLCAAYGLGAGAELLEDWAARAPGARRRP